MKLTKALMVIALFAGIFVACKKEDDDKEPTPSETEGLLTSGSWLLKNFKIDGVDANSEIDACEWDDIYTYSSNYKMTWDDGANRCDTTEPKTFTVTWRLGSNDKVLFQNGEASDITSISSSALVLTYDDGFEILTYEYKKK